MPLSNVDLNLLVTFDALHREGSVAAAARRVGLSPSAMSHSLARLRALFGDPLFVRSGVRMRPTPRADALAGDIRAALEHVESALMAPSDFRPEAAKQTLRLAASSDVQFALLPSLVSVVRARAPRLRVDVTDLPAGERLPRELASGELDLAVGPVGRGTPTLRRRKLLETRIVAIASAAHPRIRGMLSHEQYLREGHIAIGSSSPIGALPSPDDLLKRQGGHRRIVARVGNPELALHLVSRSDLICSVSELMAEGLADRSDLQVLEHPLAMPSFAVAAAWHARTHVHPMHQWFRRLVFDLVEQGPAFRASAPTGTSSELRH